MYNLAELTEFDPAIIYGFQPESSPERHAGSENLKDTLLPESRQYEEILEAYLYAQRVILPILKEKGPLIEKKQLLEWIKTLHGFMAKTVLGYEKLDPNKHYSQEVAEYLKVEPGEYVNKDVLRWHKGNEILGDFVNYFSKNHHCKNDQSFISFLVTTRGLKNNEARDFIKLLHKLETDKSISLSPSQEMGVNTRAPQFKAGTLVLNRLTSAYQQSLLTVEERQQVEKIVKICIDPREVPSAMEAYAEKTLAALVACDKADLDQVSHFLAESFYDFTGLHPFPNANGRVATCLMNVFLKYFGYESILLRCPGEKQDENSDYSKAIEQIDATRVPLQTHIKKQILLPKEHRFADENLEKLIELRVTLSDVLQRILNKRPSFSPDLLQNRLYSDKSFMKTLYGLNSHQQTVLFLTAFIKSAEKEYEAIVPVQNLAIANTALTDKQSEELLAAIKKLSNSEWKLTRNGQSLWMQTTDTGLAQEIADRLKTMGTKNTQISRRKDNNAVSVIVCEKSDFPKILKAAELFDEPLSLSHLNLQENDSDFQCH
ncbi:MAG: Fic family protein [Silvanigrellaceae bacterium]|nr:Fic family protein [Silvanigrellaceae bacterium]